MLFMELVLLAHRVHLSVFRLNALFKLLTYLLTYLHRYIDEIDTHRRSVKCHWHFIIIIVIVAVITVDVVVSNR